MRKNILTGGEKQAVDLFIAAARSLPKSICVDICDAFEGEPHLTVSKRVSEAEAHQVAALRKKSLVF